ncbi:hypothetical protein HDU93_000518, partial [Gonapodya sp. JEL0774]
ALMNLGAAPTVQTNPPSSVPSPDTSIKVAEAPLTLPFDPLRHVLPHGSYLINLGNPDEDVREKSYAAFLDELQRCEALGIGMYNFHPGSALSNATPELTLAALARVSELINRAHSETSFVKIVIENSAGGGGTLGVAFEQIGKIIEGVKDKTRIDAFAAGYDYSTEVGYEKAMEDFERHIGICYLSALHLNDSKSPLNSRKDRHENLGKGHIGIDAFRRVAEDQRLRGIPMILETPAREHGGEVDVYGREVEMMYAFANDQRAKST